MIPIAQEIWHSKYRLKKPNEIIDITIEDTWRRIARALAQAEKPKDRVVFEEEFYNALTDFKFLPAGRIIAGAGTDRDVTLFNCFVMGAIPDSLEGIFTHLKEAALTMQQGGGIGYDFSTLRPKGAPVKGVDSDASGPLSFMDVWDAMCRTIMSAGARRGAMMATMRCDHPDIVDFITAKQKAGRLTNFNLSVLVTDEFMNALKNDMNWELKFRGVVKDTIKASDLWDLILRSTYDYAEPGVIFIDRINAQNNLKHHETIHATNPCGEQPLPPYGACLLGSLNLTAFVEDPFGPHAHLDLTKLNQTLEAAIQMMDNVVDVSNFPLRAQAEEAQAKRRIGLGVTGLADALAMCRLQYGSPESISTVKLWMQEIEAGAYSCSARLARWKGSFPLFDNRFLDTPTFKRLPVTVKNDIRDGGLRNSHLTSIAPTGTISLMAGNVSSGIEPIFALDYKRKVLQPDGTHEEHIIEDYAVALYRQMFPDAALPPYFVTAQDLCPDDHLAIQAVCQEHIDSSISKTINVPEDITFEEFGSVYSKAYALGLKGCTTYRPTALRGSVIEVIKPTEQDKTEGVMRVVITEPDVTDTTVHLVTNDAELASIKANIEQAVRNELTQHYAMKAPRPTELPGKSYKLKWPNSDHALYLTINDIIEDGRRRPFEIFINTKDVEHFAWMVALTRMVSAIFRKGGDVSFVASELEQVFDPRGGAWIPGGVYHPSLIAMIGSVIKSHLEDMSLMAKDMEPIHTLRTCPKCQAPSLMRQEGCDTCGSCGYSKCG